MKNGEYIESGILELYVMGCTDAQETKEVERMIAAYPDIRREVDEIALAMENYAKAKSIQPNPTIKPFLMATIDYTERLAKDELVSSPPPLHEGSKIADYEAWLQREDMVLPEDFKDIYAKILNYTPEMITAIVWINEMAPPEVHDDEFERFLIVEGACSITIAGRVHYLVAGDFLSIPLHEDHQVKVTSDIPCKVILQRVAV